MIYLFSSIDRFDYFISNDRIIEYKSKRLAKILYNINTGEELCLIYRFDTNDYHEAFGNSTDVDISILREFINNINKIKCVDISTHSIHSDDVDILYLNNQILLQIIDKI